MAVHIMYKQKKLVQPQIFFYPKSICDVITFLVFYHHHRSQHDTTVIVVA